MPSFLQDLFGSKPNVPAAPIVNLGDSQKNAIANNTAALPADEALVSKSNQFSQQQITQMLQSIIPGYSGMVTTASGNISDELAGKVPSDVSSAVQNSDAARALGGGYAGSGAHGNLVARDLGLTSLDLTQKGLSSFEDWTKMSDSLYQPSQMNVSSMFVTPGQEYQAEETNATNKFQTQWMSNQIAAEPDPETVGLFNLATSVVGGAAKSAGGASGGGL